MDVWIDEWFYNLDSTAVEKPDKFQSDQITLNQNPVVSKLREI